MNAEQLIAYVNALARKDPDALRALLAYRVPVVDVLAVDPTIEAEHRAPSGLHTAKARGSQTVSVLALLAGVATQAQAPGAPPIRFRLTDDNGAPAIQIVPAEA